MAIPSVLGFNYLNGLVVREETMLNNAAGELIDLAESWAEHEIEALHAKQAAPRAAVTGNGKIERTAAAMEPA